MKKIMLLAVAGTGLAMYSCNKNYDCSCTDKLNNKDTVIVYSVKERSKSNAKVACENRSDSNGNCLLNN